MADFYGYALTCLIEFMFTFVLVAPISATKSSLPKTIPSITNADLFSKFLAAKHMLSSCSREREDSTKIISPILLFQPILPSTHSLKRIQKSSSS